MIIEILCWLFLGVACYAVSFLVKDAFNIWRVKRKMKHLALGAVLCLCLVSIMNPSLYLDGVAIGNELKKTGLFTVADGGPVLADTDGLYSPLKGSGNYTDTQTDNEVYDIAYVNLYQPASDINQSIWQAVNFTLPSYESIVLSSASLNVRYENTTEVFLYEFVDAWDWTASVWDRLHTNTTNGADNDHDITVSLDSSYMNSSRCVSVRFGTNWTLSAGGVWEFNGSMIDVAWLYYTDSVAPSIVRSFVSPGEPTDNEVVTLSAVVDDNVAVSSVTFNAIVSPDAFNDIDYSAIEQSDNLWIYSFSAGDLPQGYYCFKIVASDGTNTNDPTEYAFIDIMVRESAIEITIYTFFGAGSDFSYMQYSGHINRDCTYNISEWSDSWAKNETHTGSVSEGMFNIAWDKIGVDDLDANFTIVFVNGSLSLTIEGYYGTAYKELRITEIKVDNPEQSQANTSITVNFYANKDVDWFVYDVDMNDAVLASGSSLEGSDALSWTKNRTTHIHNYAVKWTDGVSNIWFNSSYWTYKENIDSLDQPGIDWNARDKRLTIEFWTTVGAFIALGGVIAIGLSHYKLNKKIGKLPNYQTQ